MIYTEFISLIEINDEIFIVWIFYSWLKMMLLILKNYWCNSNYINYIKFIDIEHVQLKLLTFKNNLILMGILKIPFIVRAIASMVSKDINDTVNCFQLINDIKIEFWKKLISADLMMIQFVSDDNVFQIFMISEHNYRVNSIIDFKILFFKYFDNNQ